MDCLLANRTSVGFIHLPGSVFDSEMAAGDSSESISRLHRDDQLRNLFAPEDPPRCCENVSLRSAPISRPANYHGCDLSLGRPFVASNGKASPQIEKVFRSTTWQPGRTV